MPLAALPPQPPVIERTIDTLGTQPRADSLDVNGFIFTDPDSLWRDLNFPESMLPAREGFDFSNQTPTIEARPLYRGESGVIFAEPHIGGMPPARNLSSGRR